VSLVLKAAAKIRVTIFSNPSGQKINELVITSNKLTNNYADLIMSGFEPDVARLPPL
jgi:hypothetical protein